MNVARIRLRLGLTQAELAEVLDISVRTVQEWEQGRRKPTGAARTLLSVLERVPEVMARIHDSRIEKTRKK